MSHVHERNFSPAFLLQMFWSQMGPSFSAVGFAELEYGMLRLMGAIDDDTPAAGSIRECCGGISSDIDEERVKNVTTCDNM